MNKDEEFEKAKEKEGPSSAFYPGYKDPTWEAGADWAKSYFEKQLQAEQEKVRKLTEALENIVCCTDCCPTNHCVSCQGEAELALKEIQGDEK